MMKKYTVVLASHNKGKIAELDRLLRDELGDLIELKSLDDIGFFEEIEENGATFRENALIKANCFKVVKRLYKSRYCGNQNQ